MAQRSPSGPIVLLNGAFGVGKTTVARGLQSREPRITIFDPERIGYVLRRLPAWLPGSTKHLDDYQESPLWRRLTVSGARRRAAPGRVLVIPMTFARVDVLNEIRTLRTERPWLEVCLTAKDAVLSSRLAARGVSPESPEGRWVYPRAFAAAAAHRAGGFGITIDTDGLDAERVTNSVHDRIDAFLKGA